MLLRVTGSRIRSPGKQVGTEIFLISWADYLKILPETTSCWHKEHVMRKISIAGAAGRMGGMIAALAEESGFALAALMDRPQCLEKLAKWGCPCASDPTVLFKDCPDAVIIDFTTPQASLHTAALAGVYGNPLVIGVTGFDAGQKAELEHLALQSPILWSPNMSVGVNVLLDILPRLARLLGPDYDLEMMEIHHNKKRDAPSGTALRLAESMAEGRGWKLEEVIRCERSGLTGERPAGQIGIQAIRGGDVAGVHTAYFIGQGERIEITHHAHSRENFARGALRAARWMFGRKPGRLYSIQDVLAGPPA
jgi:4-hydroxy-tetrahydrodipicolinate reductase